VSDHEELTSVSCTTHNLNKENFVYQSITATEFKLLAERNPQIDVIDVRTPPEFAEVHIVYARNEPLDKLDTRSIQALRVQNGTQPLYVVCRSGARSKQACEKLLAAGSVNVINIDGGTNACISAGVNVVRGGRKAWPLHCQVQIITGLSVVVGAVLSVVTHPAWIALPLAMGAGLAFSGLTNTCAMGAILARMPWNNPKPIVAKPTPATSNDACQTTAGNCCG
jgi:rhodanese-related sulfurtransferase